MTTERYPRAIPLVAAIVGLLVWLPQSARADEQLATV